MKLILFSVLIIFLFNCNKDKNTYVFPESNNTSINDFENIITKKDSMIIDSLIAFILKKDSIFIVICTMDSIPKLPKYANIQVFTGDLFNHWGIGRKGKDDGMLIFLSKKNRRWSINNGYFTEYVIHDSTCARIGKDFFLPEFKKGNYGKGFIKGLNEIHKALDKSLRKMYPEKYE